MESVRNVSEPKTSDLIDIGATTLYYGLRGAGPAMLLIAGGTGRTAIQDCS